MGKNKKEHRKKVNARNQRIKEQQRAMDRVYKGMFEKIMNERLKALSGDTTETPETNQ